MSAAGGARGAGVGGFPITHEMEVPAEGEPDFLRLPDAAAVMIFESAEGRTTLIATTASARDLARRRLSAPGAAAEEVDGEPAARRSKRADMRSITARVMATRVGSALEADIAYVAHARARMPEAAQVTVERWRPWFVHVDPEAEFPQFTKTNLGGASGGAEAGTVAARSASTALAGDVRRGVLLGPIPNKDAAGRFIETMVDAFDLCRFHNLLVQAPRAMACAYKEMGRCPAPCDGTETMGSYRERVREAAAAGADLAGFLAKMDAEMRSAGAAGEFERAGRIKVLIERLKPVSKPTFGHVRASEDLRFLFVQPSTAKGWARVVAFAQCVFWVWGDVRVDAGAKVVEEWSAALLRVACEGARLPECALMGGKDWRDGLALLAHHLFSPAKGRGAGIPLAQDATVESVARAVKRMLSAVSKGKNADEVIESAEMEGGAV